MADFELDIAYWIGHNGAMERVAANTVLGMQWKKLTDPQRALVNELAARYCVKVVDGIVVPDVHPNIVAAYAALDKIDNLK